MTLRYLHTMVRVKDLEKSMAMCHSGHGARVAPRDNVDERAISGKGREGESKDTIQEICTIEDHIPLDYNHDKALKQQIPV